MKIRCWLRSDGETEENQENGKIFCVNCGTRIKWLVWRRNFNAENLEIVVNGKPKIMKKSIKGTFYYEKVMKKPGIRKFWLRISGQSGIRNMRKQKILVQPKIYVGEKGIMVEDIRMQTNLSRCLGKIKEWEKNLAGQVEVGFNFIHLTSVNELGKYKSLYCIGDYSKLNNEFFSDNDLTEPEKLQKLSTTIDKINDLGAKVIVDLVLSHCSSENPIFKISPDAAYTLENSPHLNVSFALDNILSSLSKLMSKFPQNYKFRNQINNTESLQYTMSLIKDQILNQNLFEYFCIDTEKTLKSFSDYSAFAKPIKDSALLEYLKKNGFKKFLHKKLLMNKGSSRFGCIIKVKKLWKYSLMAGMNTQWVLREGIKEINQVNSNQISKFSRRISKIFQNIENEIRYQKLELRVFEVSDKNPLVKPYFTYLPNGQAALLNGFIYAPKKFTEDISEKWNYFERNVITWRDCVKLNYGKNLNDCSEWIHVIQDHVIQMASIFSGFRLDNCHGTPLWVMKHLMNLCRQKNPDLIILAEFFSNSAEIDTKYTNAIGINLLLRESLAQHSIQSLSAALLNNRPGLNVYSNIPTILYDFTHDNATIPQLRNTEDVIGNLVSVQCKIGAIGSTRGYDEVIPRQLSVVEERRKYSENHNIILNFPVYKLMGVRQGVKVHVEFSGQAACIEIFGDWDGWKVGLSLKNYEGLWRCCLEFPYSQVGMRYGFKFVIDNNKWICDERQAFYRTWDGFYNNLLKVQGNLYSMPKVSSGLQELRHRMHLLRKICKDFGYEEIKIEEKFQNVFAVCMENTKTQEKYWVLSKLDYHSEKYSNFVIRLKGKLEKIEILCIVEVVGEYAEDLHYITGIPVQVKTIEFEKIGRLLKGDEEDCIEIFQFPIGCVLVVKAKAVCEELLENIEKKINTLEDLGKSKYLVQNLRLEDLNLLLWRSAEDEKNGIYEFPKAPKVKFAGIGGFLYALKGVKTLEPSHPVYDNLFNGNWYMDYCLKRLEKLSCDVLYFFLSDLFTHIKQLPRSFIPETLHKVLKLVFRLCENYLYTCLIPDTQVPKKVLTHFTQVWTQFNIKNLCSLHPQYSNVLRPENFWAIDLLLTLNLANKAQDLIIQSASELNSFKSPSNCIHFLYALTLFNQNAGHSMLDLNLGSISIQNYCCELFMYLINSALDPESGLILAKSGESWCGSSTRAGGFIELSAMLHTVLIFFSSSSKFPQNFHSETFKLSLADWASLLKKSVELLYFIPAGGSSLYIKPELVRKDEIFKDTLGLFNEVDEYKCTANWFIAYGIAPQLFNREIARKAWNVYWEELKDVDGWIQHDEFNDEVSIWIQCWAFKSGMDLGLVSVDRCWEEVCRIFLLMENEWFGVIGSSKKTQYSGFGYWGLVKLIKLAQSETDYS